MSSLRTTAEAVHNGGVARVVDLDLEEEEVADDEDDAAHKPNDDCMPRLDHVAVGRDGHEACMRMDEQHAGRSWSRV